MHSHKSDIWLKKIRYQILDLKKNQLSDITPPKIWFMSAEIALGHTSKDGGTHLCDRYSPPKD